MKGLERTADGRCKVGSQFMIWVGDLEYKVGKIEQGNMLGACSNCIFTIIYVP